MKHERLELTAAEADLHRELYDRGHLVLADERVDEYHRDRIASRLAHEVILILRQREDIQA